MRKIFSSHFSKKGSRPWKLQGCVTGPKNILPRAGGFFFNQYNNTVLVWVHLLTTLKSNSGWFHSRLIPSYLKVMPELLDLIIEIPPCRVKQDWHSFQQLVRYALQAVSPAGLDGQLGQHFIPEWCPQNVPGLGSFHLCMEQIFQIIRSPQQRMSSALTGVVHG